MLKTAILSIGHTDEPVLILADRDEPCDYRRSTKTAYSVRGSYGKEPRRSKRITLRAAPHEKE